VSAYFRRIPIRRQSLRWRERWHVPGHELCYGVDGVVGDTGEDVSQVAFRVDAVEIGCAEKRIDGSGPFSAAIGTGEEIVFFFRARRRATRVLRRCASISMVLSSR
jgi:hypothetical protein